MADKSGRRQFVKTSEATITSSLVKDEPQAQVAARPTLVSLFLVWCKISIQSFGGGSSTLLLMRREFVDKHQWFTAEEYTRFWSLGQLSPGIILVAMSILMGRRLAGTAGIVVSLVGILLPSATITALLTACFALIQTLRPVQAMIQGVLPATAGIMLALSIQFAHPLIRQSYESSIIRLIECMVIIIGSTLALTLFHFEVWIVLPVAAFICIAVFLPLDTFLTPDRAR
jgi:chromate transporter